MSYALALSTVSGYETGGQPDGGPVQWRPGRRPDRLVGRAGGQCAVVAVCAAPLRADAGRRLAQELAESAFDPGSRAAGGRRTFCQVGHPSPSAPRTGKVPRAGGTRLAPRKRYRIFRKRKRRVAA